MFRTWEGLKVIQFFCSLIVAPWRRVQLRHPTHLNVGLGLQRLAHLRNGGPFWNLITYVSNFMALSDKLGPDTSQVVITLCIEAYSVPTWPTGHLSGIYASFHKIWWQVVTYPRVWTAPKSDMALQRHTFPYLTRPRGSKVIRLVCLLVYRYGWFVCSFTDTVFLSLQYVYGWFVYWSSCLVVRFL